MKLLSDDILMIQFYAKHKDLYYGFLQSYGLAFFIVGSGYVRTQ